MLFAAKNQLYIAYIDILRGTVLLVRESEVSANGFCSPFKSNHRINCEDSKLRYSDCICQLSSTLFGLERKFTGRPLGRGSSGGTD